MARSKREWAKLVDHMKRQARGLRTFDPMVYKGPNEKEQLEKLDLVRLKNGRLAEADK